MPKSPAVPDVSSGTDREPSRAPAAAGAAVSLARNVLTSRAFRWGFVAATVALGCYAVVSHWAGFRGALDRIGVLTAAAAFAAVLAAMVAAMRSWRALLAGLGSPLPSTVAARVMFVGQLGKYLPGSVWPVLAQMELASAHRVPRRRSASAAVLSMLVSLFSGLLVAGVTLPFTGGSTPYLWALLAVPVLMACLHPRLLNAGLARLFRLARRPPPEQSLTTRTIVTSLAWAVLSWLLYGLQLWLLTTRLGASPGHAALLAVGGFAFAWSVGFIIVFAPAGAGFRDVLLIALLAPVIGTGAATAVTVLSRALTTAGDLLTAGLSVAFSRVAAPPHPTRPQDKEPDGAV